MQLLDELQGIAEHGMLRSSCNVQAYHLTGMQTVQLLQISAL